MRLYDVRVSLPACCFLLSLAWLVKASDSKNPHSWSEESDAGNFVAELVAPASDIGLSQFQSWQLSIRDAVSNQAITQARIVVGGGMAAHGHGLPTQPQVTKHLGDGVYLVEGLMFNMAGEWQLIFDVNTKKVSDRIVFDVIIQN